MNSKLYNRLVNAYQRLDKLGITHVTLTIPAVEALSVSGSMMEMVAATMERQATMYEAQDDIASYAVEHIVKQELANENPPAPKSE